MTDYYKLKSVEYDSVYNIIKSICNGEIECKDIDILFNKKDGNMVVLNVKPDNPYYNSLACLVDDINKRKMEELIKSDIDTYIRLYNSCNNTLSVLRKRLDEIMDN